MKLARLALIIGIFAVAACTSSSSGSGATPTPLPTPDIPATLANVQVEVFTPSCTNAGCHDATAAGNLDLRPGQSYAALVNVAAAQTNAAARGKVRVVPGDPTNSFFMQKLDGTFESDEGIAMPYNDSSLVTSALALIHYWIADGAQNN